MTLPLLEQIEIAPGQWVSGEQATLTQWNQALDLATRGEATSLLQKSIARRIVGRALKIGACDGVPLLLQLRALDGYIPSMSQRQRKRRSKVLEQFQDAMPEIQAKLRSIQNG
jgi:hypothetical protein